MRVSAQLYNLSSGRQLCFLASHFSSSTLLDIPLWMVTATLADSLWSFVEWVTTNHSRQRLPQPRHSGEDSVSTKSVDNIFPVGTQLRIWSLNLIFLVLLIFQLLWLPHNFYSRVFSWFPLSVSMRMYDFGTNLLQHLSALFFQYFFQVGKFTSVRLFI